MSLLAVGSIALDTVQTPSGAKSDILGGSATYFSFAASNFSKVRLVGIVGNDFSSEYIKLMNANGIDTTGLVTISGRTFRWAGKYEGSMNEAQTLDTQLNVFAQFDPVLPKTYRESKWVFLGNIDPVLQQRVLKQAKKTCFSALDTMNFWISGARSELLKALKKIDLLFINDTEAKLLAEESNLPGTVRAIRSFGPKIIVIKRGEYGSILYHDKSWFYVPGFPLDNVADPTGAGDSFAGGFMGYLAKAGRATRGTLRRAMIYGSVMASHKITGFGPFHLQKMSVSEMNKRFNSFRKLVAVF